MVELGKVKVLVNYNEPAESLDEKRTITVRRRKRELGKTVLGLFLILYCSISLWVGASWVDAFYHHERNADTNYSAWNVFRIVESVSEE